MSFTLPIFPEGSLVSSIITTTWIGVMVVSFLNLRFGWVLSGLVVPGYMVPLLIVRPWAAAVVLVESIVTYGLVWAFSEYFSRAGYWGRLFGRDRFLALVVCSVVVRIVFDGWLLPGLGAYVNEEFGLHFQYASNLHSFGLIIISLTANQFWKTGLRRGLPALFVTIGVTYLIVRYGLMEFTNFRISALSYLYEDVATSILASPKAYIILLTTAYLASRMNLNYGLDYSGILIPALMALQWYQPGKVITTIVEAFVIYFAGMAVLRLPVFAHVTIEGARKLLLFFNIGFAYKMALGFLLLWLAPEKKITDYFGFGYLLATMLAMKMHEKKILPRMTRSTLQTSLVGAAAASIIGFGAMLLSESLPLFGSTREDAVIKATAPVGASVETLLDHDRVAIYSARLQSQDAAASPEDIATFDEALRRIQGWQRGGDRFILAEARGLLERVRYSLLEVGTDRVYLRDDGAGPARGVYLIDRRYPDGLVIEVPVTAEASGLMVAGLTLMDQMDGHALAVAGAQWTATGAVGRGILASSDTFFQAFHRRMAANNVLQLQMAATSGADARIQGSTLWIKDTLPPGLNDRRLEQLIGGFQPFFGLQRSANVQRDVTASGFAELYVDEASLRRLVTQPSAADDAASPFPPAATGTLLDRVLVAKAAIARRGTDLYLAPHLDELVYFDRDVLTEILKSADLRERDGAWTSEAAERLAAAAVAARAVGYRIERLHDEAAAAEFIVLSEAEGPTSRYRGTLVLRLGERQPYILQVPRPLLEVNTLEYATQLFGRLRARALLIAGAHPDANFDGTADIANVRNRENLLSLMQQVLLRSAGRDPLMVVQCRAMRAPEGAVPPFDAILSLDSGAVNAAELSPAGTELYRQLSADDMRVSFADGSAEVAGHDIGAVAQLGYMQQVRNKEFAVLWLWLAARLPANPATVMGQDRQQFEVLGIGIERTTLVSYLARQGVVANAMPPPEIVGIVRDYRESHDVVLLQALHARAIGYRLVRLTESTTGQPYLVFLDAMTGRAAALAALWPRQAEAVATLAPSDLGPRAIESVLARGTAWIVFGSGS